MSFQDETHDRDTAHADEVLREVCDNVRSSLVLAASGAISRRYAAIPSWYATGAGSARPCRPYPVLPTWSIDADTARRLLAEDDPR